jgi:hypothetical protein
MSASSYRCLIGLAGLPPTIVYGDTSAVTTEPAARAQYLPMTSFSGP